MELRSLASSARPNQFLSALEAHPDYPAVAELLEAHHGVLQTLGITQVCHRPGSSEWSRETLVFGPDFSLENVRKILETLQAMSQLSRYFSAVHFGLCRFPQTTWAVTYIQANIDELRGKFHTVRFNEHFAAYAGVLALNVEAESPSNKFMVSLVGTVASVSPLATVQPQDVPVRVDPLPNADAGTGAVDPTESSESQPAAEATQSTLLAFLRRVQLLSAGWLSRVYPTARPQSEAEPDQMQQFRTDTAMAMLHRLFPSGADGLTLQAQDAQYASFNVMQGGTFLGWVIHVTTAAPYTVRVDQSVQDESGEWTVQPYFQGSLEEWDSNQTST